MAGLNEGKFFGQARFLELLRLGRLEGEVVGYPTRRKDSAEETLKLVERVAQHSPEQSRPEFEWCGVETGEPENQNLVG